MKRHLKSRNPDLNVPRRHQSVATDTIFSDRPGGDSGVKQTHVFVGRDSLVADIYHMKCGKQFVNTLEENIRRKRAMDKLLSDSAKTGVHCGDTMTHKLLENHTQKVIYRGAVRPITTANPNHKLDIDGGESGTSTGSSEVAKILIPKVHLSSSDPDRMMLIHL